MRIYLDKEGYVAGSISADNEGFMTSEDIIVDLPAGVSYDDFAKEQNLYRMVDGALVKDAARVIEKPASALVKDAARVIEKPASAPSTEERIAALEAALLELMGV